MSLKNFKKHITNVANNIKLEFDLSNSDIQVCELHKMVSIGEYFFVENEDATILINKIPDCINPKEYILYYLQLLGVFNKIAA